MFKLVIAALSLAAVVACAPKMDEPRPVLAPATGDLHKDISRMATAQAMGDRAAVLEHVDQVSVRESMKVFVNEIVGAYVDATFKPPEGVAITGEMREGINMAKAMTAQEVESFILPVFEGEALWAVITLRDKDTGKLVHDLSALQLPPQPFTGERALIRHQIGATQIPVGLTFSKQGDRWVWSGVRASNVNESVKMIIAMLGSEGGALPFDWSGAANPQQVVPAR